ncbi:acyl-CoA dehydrogenase family protein [Denitrificimonas sp. JX-1]|uniref:Acyl-CoA dehydrogenase family protein n=1 Tax=Denitrificimonas halotolerans TaxID=3098930 RepID=A0ABU5GM94_9GAMM|nr:acyl-CoA dehydrogenase family protein [Denitrificimonas sp. JX-1]MDY7218019.1 acyl-CoA dehydrogenase family protein [Denitrificimonas sp. JX-1]
MDFSLSEDQRAIGEMANGLFRDNCSDEQMRDYDLAAKPFMDDVWQTCIETGLHALAIPEQFGGSGLGMTELFCVLEAQGASLAQVPIWQHQLAACCLAEFAGEAHQDLLGQAAAGELLFAVSLSALNSSQGIQLVASAAGDDYSVQGHVGAVPYAAQAQRLLVLAQSEEGPCLVLLDPAAEGVSLVEGTANNGVAAADVQCDKVHVAGTALLPLAAVEWLEQRIVAAVASLQLGVSAEQISRTAEYLKEREQFGRAIGTFQAVQMTMADCHIAVEALRSALYQLLYRLDAGLPSPSEALATQYLSCEAAHLVGHKTQHVHGGIGVDLTYPIHRFLYWSRHLSMVLGSASGSVERLGDWLANNDKLGWKYDLEENQITR